ncbi:DEAD/DEAH box helicase [Mycolicibacterium sp. OfavD-34-C]|uniref:DEAD/DEAH box helicase n=1 Tax=Mycolicibacterium sp. OfavD-34-C TaxID=2917746 RepID=UPI001EF65B67|nr:DEAD/DEAH box helicase family protein [Mycolicibacterium sp. OfavD-34-C]MCG7578802.1 DEAD/DEAH box helicase family protein [Mycolicibacterium sp. OfavD-34-C]
MISAWGDASGELAKHVQAQTEQCLNAYRAKPNLIEQDAGIEISNVEGGYGKKQLNELVQNAADALLGHGGSIALVLAGGTLYAANEGSPLSKSGVETLMASHLSRKRDEEIGRFGLGFKSVLGISDRPELISRSVSVRFDRSESERLCRAIYPDSPRTPVLRIGFPFDPAVAAVEDPVLASLMSWASTVVRLPLKSGTEWLAEELFRFPPEFLLFTDHVHELNLRNDDIGRHDSWWTEADGNQKTLRSKDGAASWHIYRVEHQPSAAARKDAGTIAGRDKIEVRWAVPKKGRARQGRFWSSFPTNSSTSLAGIVNAPFKTNEDRHDILEGLYNREILTSVLPNLVAQTLDELVDPEDPASILEILPSRKQDERSWADEVINEPIMTAVAMNQCLPDMDGTLTYPARVKLHPGFLVEFNSWKERWAGVTGHPVGWVHHSIDRTPERRFKAERLIKLAHGSERNVGEWLHDLAADGGVQGSQEAIKIAALIDKHAAEHMMDMRRSEFVLAADGKLKRPSTGLIFLPESSDIDEGKYVHPEVVADEAVVEALSALNIGRLDQRGRLRAHIAHLHSAAYTRSDIEQLWELTRGLPVKEAADALNNGFGIGKTPAISMAGMTECLANLLMPGTIVPSDGSRDVGLALDTRVHAVDRELLHALGATAEPVRGIPGSGEKWYQQWQNAAHEKYAAWLAGRGGKFQQSKTTIIEGRTLRGLDICERLSEEGKFALTQHILNVDLASWYLDTPSAKTDARMPFPNPALWWVTRHGFVKTAWGLVPVKNAFGCVPGVPDHVLPVAQIPAAQQAALHLRMELANDDWQEILRTPWRHLDQASLGELYGYAASYGAAAPDQLAVQVGVKKTVAYAGETYVTADEAIYQLAASAHPVIHVISIEHENAVIDRWGLRDAAELVNRAVLAAVSGEPSPLIDRFPGLRVFPESVVDIELIPCSDLSVEVTTEGSTGPTVSEHAVLRDGEARAYFLDHLSDAQLLKSLNDELRLQLDVDQLARVLTIGARSEGKKLAATIRRESNQDKKLLLLAGVEALRRELPAGAVALAERRKGCRLEDVEIAAMARMSKGAALVERLRPTIADRGLDLPNLAGGYQARAAMRDLGLSEEFAGSRGTNRAPRFEVLGPVTLPVLHPYQQEVVEKLLDVLRPGGDNRGLVALPTGSGKTRVAVEALIRYIHKCETDPLFLWIAQSDELCEQAVDAWRYAWSAIGPAGERLTVSRLWGANDATPVDEGFHLVVATDDKLSSLSGKGQHEWLTDADVVLVDEAHTSISPTYTKLFDWLKRGTRQRDRILLGLSATPYRGNNEDQTRTLVNRYDSNLLTDGVLGEDPYRTLQDMGILARVRHKELDGMVLRPNKNATRSEGDAAHLGDYRIDLNEVAADRSRNEKILDHIENLPSDMTALVFAASVQHAEVLAAVLAGNGIPSASIAGYTPTAERRRLIERFRAGDVRVLTNYNVLSQGFDAPKVGAVYVARPTFSPNRYQQMIGRGLRGPKNGGSEEVLIVNVRDNIDAFGTQLAFTHFNRLWTEGR